VALGPSHIFQPIITTSTAQLLEIDFNLHKSNSTYFADVDISRAHLVCTLFAKGIEKMRGGTSLYAGPMSRRFGLALGAVSCNFRKQVAPYEQYEMWSRLLSWDDKWVYIVTHFVRKDAAKPRSFSLYPPDSDASESPEFAGIGTPGVEATDHKFRPEKELFATALSKCVFKSGRETVAPTTMLQLSGLLGSDLADDELFYIEKQRREGWRTASVLAAQNQIALETEFGCGDWEVLGRHTDGTGVAGVVNTLLQLAGLRRTQTL
jgi:hypothetical protein